METKNLPAVINTAITEQKLDLSQVNLMLPTQTFGDVLGQFDKVTIEVVQVDPNPKNGDVYEVSKGNYSLGKRPLQAISNAIGLIWDPSTTTVIESSSTKARAKATAAMRKPNGEMIISSEEKTVDLEAIEEKLRITQEDYAENGKLIRWDSGKPVHEPWSKHGGESAKRTHIDREVRKALIQYRLFKDERAMTGAKERVTKAFLAIKNNYSLAELSKPFAYPRVTLDSAKMLAVPEVRQAAIERMTGTVQSIFGPGNGNKEARNITGTVEAVEVLPEPEEQPEPEPPEETDPFALDEKELSPIERARLSLEDYLNTDILKAKAVQIVKETLANENATLVELESLMSRCKSYSDAVEAQGDAS